MKVSNGSQNVSDLQIENGAQFLLFDVTKKTGYDSIPAFFGDLNLSVSDNIKVLYTSRSGGQRTMIPNLPVLPVAIMATLGPQHLKAYKDVNGKINRVVFPVVVGAGGALALDDNSYLSVSTSFRDLATKAENNGVDSLHIYAVDSHKSKFIFVYESIHLNASSQKAIDLVNANQLVFSKDVLDFQLVAAATEGQTAYSINWSETEAEAIARAQNDILAAVGSDFSVVKQIYGANVQSNAGFVATEIISGGAFYNAMGVTDFTQCKITSQYDDRAYVLRVVPIENI